MGHTGTSIHKRALPGDTPETRWVAAGLASARGRDNVEFLPVVEP